MCEHAADIAFVLDRLQQLNASDASGKFTGRLDVTRLAAFGHSFGGSAAALFRQDDCKNVEIYRGDDPK